MLSVSGLVGIPFAWFHKIAQGRSLTLEMYFLREESMAFLASPWTHAPFSGKTTKCRVQGPP